MFENEFGVKMYIKEGSVKERTLKAPIPNDFVNQKIPFLKDGN